MNRLKETIRLFGRYPAGWCVLTVCVLAPLIATGCICLGYSAPSTAYVEENRGQASPEFAFYSKRESGATALFDRDGLTLSFAGSPDMRLRARLVGAAHTRPRGQDRLPTQVNYMIGNDPSKFILNVPTYGMVRYENVYDGISAIYYPQGTFFEQDFEVAPGADPGRIRMRFEGADSVQARNGMLEIRLRGHLVQWRAPVAYQADGRRNKTPVQTSYRVTPDGEVRFDVGTYNKRQPLVIDPVITFSTYVGGSGADITGRSALDAQGNVYIPGGTNDPTFPVLTGTTPTPASPAATGNAILVKLNATGTAAQVVTHFGGTTSDTATSVALDASGNIYVVGYTNSPDFPVTPGALRTQSYASDPGSCFVTKFNPAANRILYATYLGGTVREACLAIAVDSTGAMYVAGATDSRDFPATPDTFQPTFRAPSESPGFDGFITKINPAGNALVFSTFLGGPGTDVITGMAVDAQRNVYVTGFTNSPGFPVTQNAFQTRYGGGSLASEAVAFSLGDGFAAKVNPDGSQLVYSTFLGGREDDTGLGIAIDAKGAAYIAGGTRSANFPVTEKALQRENRGQGGDNQFPAGDAFVVKLNPEGRAAEYSTYLGGTADDRAIGIAVDSSGNAWLTGHTMSTNFPVTEDARQKTFGGFLPSEQVTFGDSFVTRLNADGTAILYSTYHGGSGNEAGFSVALTSDGSAVVSGVTGSRNLFTTEGVMQRQGGIGEPELAPFNDVFVLKIGDPPALPQVSISTVRNEASLTGESIAPGMVAIITGTNLATTTATAELAGDPAKYPIEMNGTRVLVGDLPAVLLSIAPDRIVAVIPFGVEPGTEVPLVVEASAGNRSPARTMTVAAAHPGLYSENGEGTGGSRSFNEDGSVNGEGNAARPGTILTLSGTGGGRTDPVSEDGSIATADSLYPLSLSAEVILGDQTAEVVRAGSWEGQVTGRFALQIRIPEGIPEGWYPLRLRLGEDLWSQPEFYVYAGGVQPQEGQRSKR